MTDYDYDYDLDDDYFSDDYANDYYDDCGNPDCAICGVNAATESSSNNAVESGSLSREDSMFKSGYSFATSNSTVRQLAPGTILKVTGQGQLEIMEVPVKELQPGDRFTSKYGPATVVLSSSRLPNQGLSEGEVLYIADGTNVVRRQFVN